MVVVERCSGCHYFPMAVGGCFVIGHCWLGAVVVRYVVMVVVERRSGWPFFAMAVAMAVGCCFVVRHSNNKTQRNIVVSTR